MTITAKALIRSMRNSVLVTDDRTVVRLDHFGALNKPVQYGET